MMILIERKPCFPIRVIYRCRLALLVISVYFLALYLLPVPCAVIGVGIRVLLGPYFKGLSRADIFFYFIYPLTITIVWLSGVYILTRIEKRFS